MVFKKAVLFLFLVLVLKK